MTTERRPARRRAKAQIPKFGSIQEEAESWDTHELADYWDEFKPVKVRFTKNFSQGITVRFDPETLPKLRAEAKKKGLGPTTLARMWILERLQAYEQWPSVDDPSSCLLPCAPRAAAPRSVPG